MPQRSPHPRGWLGSVVCLAVLAALLAACVSAPPAYTTRVKDPWEKLNRAIFAFNQALDKAVARSVAKQYVRAVPKPARDGIHNFVNNLGEPITIINDLLQGQINQTLKDTMRIVVNSAIGIAGWFDVARHLDLPDHDADFGETLAHWGVPAGPYLVCRYSGPATCATVSRNIRITTPIHSRTICRHATAMRTHC